MKKSKKNKSSKKSFQGNIPEKTKYISVLLPIIIFTVGILVRLLFVGQFPCGFNQDEASAGYDAFAILNYGIDRNGIPNPIHLIAWGSGQNIAYSWLCMPFIALFGLSVFSVRLPMAIVGSISVVIFYLFLKNVYNNDKKYIYIGTFLFAIFPWHIMKSRWGLESNLFPDLILWASYFISVFCKNNKSRYLYIAFAILGFSAYSYGIAYCFLPFFTLGLLTYMYVTKKITIPKAIISLAILTVIALPIIVFVIINTFDLPEINLGIFTIPRLYQNRHTEMASVFSDNFIKTSLSNFVNSLKILLTQEDGLLWNSMRFYGITYVIALPLTLWGIILSFSKPHRTSCDLLEYIMNFWFIASVILLFVVTPNINRINIIMIPMMFYTIVGTAELANMAKHLNIFVYAIFAVLFVMFTATYFTSYQKDIKPSFFYGLGDAISEADTSGAELVYVTDSVNSPYIFSLFYTKTDPNYYIETVGYNSRYTAFENIASYGKYIFHIPDEIDPDEDAVYITTYSETSRFDRDIFDISRNGIFFTVSKKQ